MNASLLGGAQAIFPAIKRNVQASEATIESPEERSMFTAPASSVRFGRGQTIEPLLLRAAMDAIQAAGLQSPDIDRLYGAVVLGAHVEPSALYGLHHSLGLRRDAVVVPQGTNFSGFLSGLAMAAEAVRFGAARHVLVLVGARMSPFVSVGSGYAMAIADGAGAVVVGPGSGSNVIMDFATDTDGSLYDASTIDSMEGGLVFGFSEKQLRGVHDYGVERPPALVAEVLRRNDIKASDVALVAHQPSRVLMEHWRKTIAPGEYIDTFDEHGNATVASIPMTLATRGGAITKPYLVLMSPGLGMHATVVLVRR